MRVQGNQIGRQRQQALDFWYDNTDFDWVLWVDSDIVLTEEALQKVWLSADKDTRPIVTGTYFISKENEASVMSPYPAVFQWTDSDYKIAYVHPLPKDVLIKTGSAGFGFLATTLLLCCTSECSVSHTTPQRSIGRCLGWYGALQRI